MNDLQYVINMKNKQFAFTCIGLMNAHGLMSAEVLEMLSNAEKCKDMFGFVREVAILKLVPDDISGEEFKEFLRDGTRLARYYDDYVLINGSKYVITNYWYGPETRMPDNKTPFLNWISRRV